MALMKLTFYITLETLTMMTSMIAMIVVAVNDDDEGGRMTSEGALVAWYIEPSG